MTYILQVGYHMVVAKAQDCKSQEVIDLVLKSVTGAKLEGNVRV